MHGLWIGAQVFEKYESKSDFKDAKGSDCHND